jgi:hypothetical protein
LPFFAEGIFKMSTKEKLTSLKAYVKPVLKKGSTLANASIKTISGPKEMM